MRMRQKLLGVAALVAVFVAGFWGVASAQSFRTGNTTTIGVNETVDNTLWVSGRTIDITGTVNGDVFCAGQNVTISGSVRGDVLCAAQTIVVSGEVAGDVRAAAQTITMTGTVARNVSAASQSFNLGAKGAIGGDANIGADDAILNGTVGRDAAIGSTTINLNGQIGRDVQATTTELSLGNGAKIGGDLSYTSKNSAKVAGGATIAGKTSKSTPKDEKKNQSAAGVIGSVLGVALYCLVAVLLISLVLVLLLPQAIHAVTNQGFKAPWKTLLIGLIAYIAVPVLIIISAITVIGIPLGLLLLCAWLLVQVSAGVVSGYFVGRLVWRNQHNPILTMLVGVTLLSIMYFIPILGFVVFAAAMLLGTGMILLEINRRRPKPNYNLK